MEELEFKLHKLKRRWQFLNEIEVDKSGFGRYSVQYKKYLKSMRPWNNDQFKIKVIDKISEIKKAKRDRKRRNDIDKMKRDLFNEIRNKILNDKEFYSFIEEIDQYL